MADGSGIDPRYAAQFQRGFDAAQHVAPPAPRGPVRLAGGPPPTAQRVPDPPRMQADVVAVPDAHLPEPGIEPTAPTPRLWWDWLLPGVGIGLIVISLMLWWSLGTDTDSYLGNGVNDEWAVFVQQARYFLPGPLLTAGMLALTGGLVLQTVKPPR